MGAEPACQFGNLGLPLAAPNAFLALNSGLYRLSFLIADPLSSKASRQQNPSLRHCPIPGE